MMSASYDKSQLSSGRPGGFVTIRPLISGQTRTTILQVREMAVQVLMRII